MWRKSMCRQRFTIYTNPFGIPDSGIHKSYWPNCFDFFLIRLRVEHLIPLGHFSKHHWPGYYQHLLVYTTADVGSRRNNKTWSVEVIQISKVFDTWVYHLLQGVFLANLIQISVSKIFFWVKVLYQGLKNNPRASFWLNSNIITWTFGRKISWARFFKKKYLNFFIQISVWHFKIMHPL